MPIRAPAAGSAGAEADAEVGAHAGADDLRVEGVDRGGGEVDGLAGGDEFGNPWTPFDAEAVSAILDREIRRHPPGQFRVVAAHMIVAARQHGHGRVRRDRQRKHVVRLVNISKSGAMVIFPHIPNIGECLPLQLLDQGLVTAQVRWVKDGRIGVSFAAPLE